MNEDSVGHFIDELYDASFEPGQWVPIMERLADMVGGTGAWLSQLNLLDGSGSGVIARIDPAMPAVYAQYYALKNPLSNVEDPEQYRRNWVTRILTDEDWMPKEELVRSEYYNDFLAPQDIHSTMMVRLSLDGYDVSALNINRPKTKPQYDQAELALVGKLHPHLIRAFGLTRKLAKVRQLNEGVAVALDRSLHGVILLDGTGRVRHANRAGEDVLSRGDALCLTHGRLSAAQPDAARRLAALVASALSNRPAGERGGSMAVTSRHRRLPLSVTVSPVRSERMDIFDSGPSALVCVTDLEARVSLPEQKLRELFGLTPAETRVTIALFEGFSPQEAAESLGVSFHTVRVHLGRVFEKTGTHRQTELVRLMMRIVGSGQDCQD